MLEKSILERIVQGEETAVADLLNRYGGLVWSLSKRFCGNSEDAEDATQEILLEVWKSANRFSRTKGSETSFVATIARRRLIDQYRAKRKKVELGQSDFEYSEPCDRLRHVEIAEEAEEITAVFHHLPHDQVNVIKLSLFEGLSHNQIAKSTGLSLGTVKTNIRRGMDRVRNLVRNEATAKSTPL